MPSIRDKIASKKSKLAIVKEKNKEHPAGLDDYQEGAFYKVPIGDINPNPSQPRKYFNETSLSELAGSIKQKGMLQPVIVKRMEDGSISLVAGERRLRAAKKAGLEEIPAILTKGNPAEIALIENLQREDLRPIEEAEALGQMLEEYDYTQEQLAEIIGKAKSTISESLSLNKLPDSIKQEVRRAEQYPRRLLVEIAKQETPEDMVRLFQIVKEASLKSDQVREITRVASNRQTRPPVAIASDKANHLYKALGKIDMESIKEVDRVQFMTVLVNIRDLINKILD